MIIDNPHSDKDSNTLIAESEVLFNELRRYISGEEVDPTVTELIDFQRFENNLKISEELHLPTPMLGYRDQESPILVVGICPEFSLRKVLSLPKNVKDFASIYYYEPYETKVRAFEEPIDYIKNFKNISYFKKIDWMLNEIWNSKDYELGGKSVYAEIIPWPTPLNWKGFEKYEHFRNYGTIRIKRLIDTLRPKAVISLGRQASGFLAENGKLFSKNNKLKAYFSNIGIPLISAARPVASNELKSFTYYESGLSDWEAKFLAHLDQIQEYLGVE